MEFETTKRAIARIHFANSKAIVGTGFLVAEKYVLTCAHVVREALGNPENAIGESLEVTFFQASKPRRGSVIFYDFDEFNYGADVAVLYLEVSLPEVENCVPCLCPIRQFGGAALNVFGYPNNDAAGRNLSAVTNGEVDGGWVQIEDTKVPGLAVEAGFSGSPVWCGPDQAIVGMVVARHQGQDQAKVGFMIPVQKLQSAIQAIKQHSLCTLLMPYNERLREQLTTAYQVCRPSTWPQPFQDQLEARLADISQMSQGKLIEFAACLLNQPDIDMLRNKLIAWVECYKSDDITLAALLTQMGNEQEKKAPQRLQVFQPCLLIRIQADKTTKQEPYQVNAWIVPDSRRRNPATREGFDPATGEGAEPLVLQDWQKYVDDPNSIDSKSGVKYEHMPMLVADYLDQVASRGIARQDLTIEFFLPLSLINKAVEQSYIPIDFGFPTPLGVDQECSHVVIRSQERLEFARGRKAWEDKWKRLQDELSTAALNVFVDGDQYSPRALQNELRQALGLKLTGRLPKASNQGDIGLMLATGTPIAVWLRCHTEDLANRLNTDILADGLETVPEKIRSMRRNTPALDEDADPGSSEELGHHLSFLWEDFYRVPPSITYSDAQL